MIAVQAGNAEAVERLLSMGVDVNMLSVLRTEQSHVRHECLNAMDFVGGNEQTRELLMGAIHAQAKEQLNTAVLPVNDVEDNNAHSQADIDDPPAGPAGP